MILLCQLKIDSKSRILRAYEKNKKCIPCIYIYDSITATGVLFFSGPLLQDSSEEAARAKGETGGETKGKGKGEEG